MKIEIREDLIICDENGAPEYVTIFVDDVPAWKELIEDERGSYIEHDNKKEYIFEKV